MEHIDHWIIETISKMYNARRVLSGLLAALVGSACPEASAKPAASTTWVMLVGYDGEPVWILAADLAQRTHAAQPRSAHTLSILLPKWDGSGPIGWVLSQERYDCRQGAFRTVRSEAWSLRNVTIQGLNLNRPSAYSSVLPGTTPVVILKALCATHTVTHAERVSGTPRAVFERQAQMRKQALGY